MLLVIVVSCALLTIVEAAKILAVFPTPSISHQVPFRPLTQELARRGHEVVIITADPAFEKGQTPKNLREVDVHDISYNLWRTTFLPTSFTGHKKDLKNQQITVIKLNIDIFVEQLKTDEVKSIIKNETFDLLLLEAWIRPALFFTHIYKDVPVIAMSTWGGWFDNYEQIGAASHPLLYPNSSAQKLNNRTMWDKIAELYKYWTLSNIYQDREEVDNRELRRFAPDMPDLSELNKNIDMMFFNVHPLWDGNRPVPPSVIFMNGIHKKPQQELPKDLESYLNSSRTGVVYVSFGSNVKPSTLPAEIIRTLVNVFSQLPYDVLWRWDKDELPGKTKNIKIFKWLPQSDLLRHPSIKVFVTQCGLQSTDEAISAGVPLVGIPMIADQWFNAEKYVHLKIGRTVELETLNEKNLKAAVDGVLYDDSYRQNVVNLRALMEDQPQPALDRAVWWTEHLLRRGGGGHLRAPSANISWREYIELDLLLVLLAVALALVISVITMIYYAVKNLSVLRFTKVKQS